MQFRLKLARAIVRLGQFISSLALMVMRRDDLLEFTRQSYLTEERVSTYSKEDFVDQGLSLEEALLVEKLPLKSGRVLVLGMGGGRDAIALARMGFAVVGIDFIPGMVEQALKNAGRCGVNLVGLVHDVENLPMPPASFDVVVYFAAMYSNLPTRQRRIAMLKQVRQVLKPGGYFLCQFFYQEAPPHRWAEWVKRAVAFVSRGNLTYERGDILFGGWHFFHYFTGREELSQEFVAGGFDVLALELSGNISGAVLQERAEYQ